MHELSSRLMEAGHGNHLAGLPTPVFLYTDDIARKYRMIFSLKKCEVVEYGTVLTGRVKEWDFTVWKGTRG